MSHNGDFGASEGERGSRGGRGGRGTRGGGGARGGGYTGRQQGGLRGGDTVHLGTGRVERAEGGESRKWEDKKAFNANRYEDKKDDKNDGGREGRTGTRGRGGDRGRNNNQTDRRFRGKGTEQSGSASAAVAAPAEENFGTHSDFPGVKFGEDGKPIVGFSASRRGRVVGATARAITAVEGGAVPLSSITFGNDDKTTAQPESQSVAADSVVNEQAPRGYRNRGGAAGGGGRGGERGATTRTDFGPKRDGGYRGASAKPIDEGAAAATGGDEGHGGDSGTARGARAAATAAPSNSEIKADEGDQQHDGFIPLAQSPPPARVLVDDTAGMSSRGHWAGGRGRGGGTFARAAATEGNEQNGGTASAKRERGDIKTGRSDGRGGGNKFAPAVSGGDNRRGTAGEGGYTRKFQYNKDGANTGRGPRDNQATEAANNASKEQTTGYGNRQYAGRRQDDAGGRGGNNTNRRGGRDQARN